MAKKSLIELWVVAIIRGIFKGYVRRKVTGNKKPYSFKDACRSAKNSTINFIVNQAWRVVGMVVVYGALVAAQKFL